MGSFAIRFGLLLLSIQLSIKGVIGDVLTTNCGDHCGSYAFCLASTGLHEHLEYQCVHSSRENETLLLTVEANVDGKGMSVIGEMTLDPTIARLTIAAQGTRNDSRTAVEVASTFSINSAQAIDISLVNLTVSSAIARLLRGLPETTTRLRLENGMLTEFPQLSLLTLRSLTHLNLDRNGITTIGDEAYSPSIVSLSVQGNGMHTFQGYFPRLQTLSLTANQFTKIPESVFRLEKLSRLYEAVYHESMLQLCADVTTIN